MKTPKLKAPASAKALEAAMQGNQLAPTATEQAIGGRKANPTPHPNPDDTEPPKPETPKVENPKKPKKEVLKPVIEKIFVRRDFVDGEFADMGRKLGLQQRELIEIDAQLKSIKSDFKARSDKVEAEINRLSNALNDGYAMIEVESLVLIAIDPTTKAGQKCYYERTGKFIKAEPFNLNGGVQLDMFALHPSPKAIHKKLSNKVLMSAV